MHDRRSLVRTTLPEAARPGQIVRAEGQGGGTGLSTGRAGRAGPQRGGKSRDHTPLRPATRKPRRLLTRFIWSSPLWDQE